MFSFNQTMKRFCNEVIKTCYTLFLKEANLVLFFFLRVLISVIASWSIISLRNTMSVVKAVKFHFPLLVV